MPTPRSWRGGQRTAFQRGFSSLVCFSFHANWSGASRQLSIFPLICKRWHFSVGLLHLALVIFSISPWCEYGRNCLIWRKSLPHPPLQRKSLPHPLHRGSPSPSLQSLGAHKCSPAYDGVCLALGSQKLHMGNSDTQTFTF